MEQLNKDTSQNSTPPTDPNNWLPDYATDTWYFKHCITTDAKGTDVLDPKYKIYNQRIWIGDRILVLQSRVTEIVDSYHNGILQGHWGIAKTISIIKRKYFILEITKYVQQHVAHCQQCFVNNNISSEPTSTKTGQQQKPLKARTKRTNQKYHHYNVLRPQTFQKKNKQKLRLYFRNHQKHRKNLLPELEDKNIKEQPTPETIQKLLTKYQTFLKII